MTRKSILTTPRLSVTSALGGQLDPLLFTQNMRGNPHVRSERAIRDSFSTIVSNEELDSAWYHEEKDIKKSPKTIRKPRVSIMANITSDLGTQISRQKSSKSENKLSHVSTSSEYKFKDNGKKNKHTRELDPPFSELFLVFDRMKKFKSYFPSSNVNAVLLRRQISLSLNKE